MYVIINDTFVLYNYLVWSLLKLFVVGQRFVKFINFIKTPAIQSDNYQEQEYEMNLLMRDYYEKIANFKILDFLMEFQIEL